MFKKVLFFILLFLFSFSSLSVSAKVKAAKKQQSLIEIGDMPSKDKTLKVILNENDGGEVTAKIYKNGTFLQKVTNLYVSPMVSDAIFVDANFDGNTDIYIGVGESRTANELLIWDNDIRRFIKVEEGWQNFTIDPSTKSVYTGGSTSFCTFDFHRYTWKKNKLCLEENVYIFNPVDSSFDIDEDDESAEVLSRPGVVLARYTLKDKNDKLIIATNELSLLPGKWPDVLEWNKGNY